MLSYTDIVLRAVLNRLSVNAETLSRLIHVTATLQRKTHIAEAGTEVIQVIFEILMEGLRLKARVLPATMKAMLEVSVLRDTS